MRVNGIWVSYDKNNVIIPLLLLLCSSGRTRFCRKTKRSERGDRAAGRKVVGVGETVAFVGVDEVFSIIVIKATTPKARRRRRGRVASDPPARPPVRARFFFGDDDDDEDERIKETQEMGARVTGGSLSFGAADAVMSRRLSGRAGTVSLIYV